MRWKKFLFGFALSVGCTLSASIVGCATSLYEPLLGNGPLPLSATNPYLGANHFLGEQLSRSRFLRELFLQRGGPDAIEVTHRNSMQLLYIRHRHTYYADWVGDTEGPGEWVVRGPFAMPRRQYVNLLKLGIHPAAAPVFVVNGRITNFRIPQSPTATPTPPPPLPIVKRPRRPIKPATSGAIDSHHGREPANETANTHGITTHAPTISMPDQPPTPNSDQRALAITRKNTPAPVNLLQHLLHKSEQPTQSPTPTPLPATTQLEVTPSHAHPDDGHDDQHTAPSPTTAQTPSSPHEGGTHEPVSDAGHDSAHHGSADPAPTPHQPIHAATHH